MGALDAILLVQELEKAKNILATTLVSIGDGVIVNDWELKVTSLNSVAEQLTEHSLSSATGQPVAEILSLVNENSGKPVENPLVRALSEGHVITLASDSALLAKSGIEIPIDESRESYGRRSPQFGARLGRARASSRMEASGGPDSRAGSADANSVGRQRIRLAAAVARLSIRPSRKRNV